MFNFRELLLQGKDSTIVITVTSGSDPSFEIKEIAFENPGIGEKNYFELALGDASSDDALQMIRTASRNGQWCIIKNTHLDPAFLQQLERVVPSLEPSEKFKLILTTEATPRFPNVLLQNSCKIAYEAPPGFINQFRRTLSGWTEEKFGGKHNLLSLAYFSRLVPQQGLIKRRFIFIFEIINWEHWGVFEKLGKYLER
jgi:hypothetical protein